MVPLLVLLFWVEPGDEYMNEEPVEYANEDQSFDNYENFAGKMTIPSISLLSLPCQLFALSLCLRYLPPVYHASHIAMSASNPPFLANRCLAMFPLFSAPLIALLVTGEDEVCSMLEHGYCWDIIIISCLL